MGGRIGPVIALAAIVVGSLLVLAAGPASAQDKPDVPVQHIIPRPNSGTKPVDSGDRGGALQLGLLGLTVVVLVGGTLHVIRQSHKARGL